MPFPAGLTLVSVHGHVDALPDGGEAGTARFLHPYPLIGPTDNSIVLPRWEYATIDAAGDFTISLPATNDPGWTPVDWAYTVEITSASGTTPGTLQLDYQTTTVELSDLIQIDGTAVAGMTYIPLSLRGAASGVASLDASTKVPVAQIPAIAISGVTDLQTQLDSKLNIPVEPYITAAAIANLVSIDTLNESQTDQDEVTATKLTGQYLDISTAPTTGTWVTGDMVLTRIGWARCTSGGTPGTWALLGPYPELDAGYAGWNFQPGDAVQGGVILPAGGLSMIMRFRAVAPTISSMQVHLTTAPSGITNAFCSLHNDAGAVLGSGAKSANRASDFTTGGMKTMPLTGQQAVTPGAFYRWRIWFTTTTSLPTMSRATSSAPAIINPNQPTTAVVASTPLRWASGDGGLTDMASAPDQIGNITGTSVAYWCGALP